MSNNTLSSKRVVLAGASGLVGGFCLELLLNSPKVKEVSVFVRRPLDQKHQKLKEIQVDFLNLDHAPVQGPMDAVFCCLGTTIREAGSRPEFQKVDLDYVIALAQWGVKHQAQDFLVVSSMGADKTSPVFYSCVKGKMEDEISKLGYRSVHIFRPSLLVGNRKKPRRGEKVGEKVLSLLNPIMQGPLRKYRAIQAEAVARAMVNRLLESQPGSKIYLSDEIQLLSNRAKRL